MDNSSFALACGCFLEINHDWQYPPHFDSNLHPSRLDSDLITRQYHLYLVDSITDCARFHDQKHHQKQHHQDFQGR